MPKEIKIVDGKKRCSKCMKEKTIEEFHKSISTKSGLMSRCKDCRNRNYYLPNRKEILKKRKKYRLKNKKEINLYQREYYKKNRMRCLNYCRKYWFKIKMEILTHYGGNPPKCACCNESRIEFLTIDHISGKGNKHRRKIFGGKCYGGLKFYQWLIKNNFPDGYQVLCYNCNIARAHNDGICPHIKRSY